jgi:hypothetical protein
MDRGGSVCVGMDVAVPDEVSSFCRPILVLSMIFFTTQNIATVFPPSKDTASVRIQGFWSIFTVHISRILGRIRR